jgi:hypothetical protein
LCYIHFFSFYFCYIRAILTNIFLLRDVNLNLTFTIIIQIRRLSYYESIKTIDIYKHVDILGIQTYIMNNFTVVFINKRPLAQTKSVKVGYSSISCCKTCKRHLVDSSYFCSLECKVNCWSQSQLFFPYHISHCYFTHSLFYFCNLR